MGHALRAANRPAFPDRLHVPRHTYTRDRLA
jgi:hypothetical protein